MHKVKGLFCLCLFLWSLISEHFSKSGKNELTWCGERPRLFLFQIRIFEHLWQLRCLIRAAVSQFVAWNFDSIIAIFCQDNMAAPNGLWRKNVVLPDENPPKLSFRVRVLMDEACSREWGQRNPLSAVLQWWLYSTARSILIREQHDNFHCAHLRTECRGYFTSASLFSCWPSSPASSSLNTPWMCIPENFYSFTWFRNWTSNCVTNELRLFLWLMWKVTWLLCKKRWWNCPTAAIFGGMQVTPSDFRVKEGIRVPRMLLKQAKAFIEEFRNELFREIGQYCLLAQRSFVVKFFQEE